MWECCRGDGAKDGGPESLAPLPAHLNLDIIKKEHAVFILKRKTAAFLLAAVLLLGQCSWALAAAEAEDAAALAKKLSNPVASLISVPIQYNYDENFGPADDGEKNLINIQPVIPVSLNEDWNVISRTILPVVSLQDIPSGSGSTSGIGDILQSVFFSPKAPTEQGLIWGAGPVFLLPTASDKLLGGEKWGIGPTAVALKQQGSWTMGFLGNHVWSFAGEDSRSDVNATYVQPFLTFTTKKATTFGLNTETTYDWTAESWSVPINLSVSQMLKFGKQLVQVGGGVRYWADSPDAGAEEWGFRLALTFLFPK